MTHKIHFALRVANREAMDLRGGPNTPKPWRLDIHMETVPRYDEFVWIPSDGQYGIPKPVIRARCGTPDHLYDYPSRTISIKLHLDRLSADDARTIGVKHEPWMQG